MRLAHPDKHIKAITSRQKKMVITSSCSETAKVEVIYRRMVDFFTDLKSTAPQLKPQVCWERILAKAMAAFKRVTKPQPLKRLPAPA